MLSVLHGVIGDRAPAGPGTAPLTSHPVKLPQRLPTAADNDGEVAPADPVSAFEPST